MLANTLITISISAISLSAIIAVLGQSYNIGKETDIQAVMDIVHSNALHKASSFEYMRTSLNLENSNSAAALCLKGQGSNCHALHQQVHNFNAQATDMRSFYALTGSTCTGQSASCNIEVSSSYMLLCNTSTECSDVKVTVNTNYHGLSAKKKLETRSNHVLLNSKALVSRGEINFSCTQNLMFMGVDYTTLTALCDSISGQTSTISQRPARGLGAGMEIALGSTNCTKGISGLNLFGNNSRCLGGGAAFTGTHNIVNNPAQPPTSGSSEEPSRGPAEQPAPTRKSGTKLMISAVGHTFGFNGEDIAMISIDNLTGTLVCSRHLTWTDGGESGEARQSSTTTGAFSSDYASCSGGGRSATAYGNCQRTTGGDNDACIGANFNVNITDTSADGCILTVNVNGTPAQHSICD